MAENNEKDSNEMSDLENLEPENEVELICDACGEEFCLTKAEIEEGADVSFCPECLGEAGEGEGEGEGEEDDEDELDDEDEDDTDDEDELDELDEDEDDEDDEDIL